MFTSSEAFASIVPAAPNPGQVLDFETRREASGLFTSRYLLKRPFASDYKNRQYRMPREVALTKRYIEVNPSPLVFSLVLDVDKEDALDRAFRPDLPRPSWVAQSPSGKAHVGYMLAVPFSTTDPAQGKAFRLAARVEEGLRRQLEADRGYVGHITKNPLHGDWDTKWGPNALHTLARMAEDLGTSLPGPVGRKGFDQDYAGLGRNCLLFEKTRVWAYSAVRRYWEDGPDAFFDAVHDHVQLLNSGLAVPLPAVEVKGLATGITRWTWAHMTPEGFKEVQTERGTKGGVRSGQVRTARALEREQAVMQLRAEGHRWQAIADTLGMSLRAAQAIGLRAKKTTHEPISNMSL